MMYLGISDEGLRALGEVRFKYDDARFFKTMARIARDFLRLREPPRLTVIRGGASPAPVVYQSPPPQQFGGYDYTYSIVDEIYKIHTGVQSNELWDEAIRKADARKKKDDD